MAYVVKHLVRLLKKHKMWSSIMAAAKKSKKDVKGSTVSAHRRARYDYEIIAQYDAGLV